MVPQGRVLGSVLYLLYSHDLAIYTRITTFENGTIITDSHENPPLAY